MKITFVTSHLTIFGGGGKFLMDYANALNKRGHEINIITQRINQEIYTFDQNINLIEIGHLLPSNPLFWLRFRSLKKKYEKTLENINSNLIISLNFPVNYFCSKINKNPDVKHVYYCLEPYRYFHDKKFYSSAPFLLKIYSGILRFMYKKYDIKAVQTADNIISISNFIKKKVKEAYNRDSYVHYIGVKIEAHHIISTKLKSSSIQIIDEKSPFIFILGLSHHMKGAKELILIFYKILKYVPELTLIIGGFIKKENKKSIIRYMKKLKIPQEKVMFYGFIKRKSLKTFYEKSILTFFTAIDESYGLIPLESMAAGTPVITFEGGPSETILNEKNGFIIKSYDINNFTQKALKLLNDNLLYEKFCENAKKHVEDNFSFKKSVLEFDELLNKIKNNH
jgi:glycosyltransferase involved in cell wall biosynthesis